MSNSIIFTRHQILLEWRMRRAGHVVRLGEMRNANKILVGKPERKNHSEDLGVDGRIILKWILRQWFWRVWIGVT
jgi:hypothetical protein